jgi:hypothetical protein
MSFLDSLFQSKLSNETTTFDYISSDPEFNTDSNYTLSDSPLDFLDAYTASLGYNLKLQRENFFLKSAIDATNTDLYTNNRKSFYENQYISDASSSYRMWLFVYLFFYFIYIYLLFFIENESSFVVIYIYTLLLFMFPFFSTWISGMLVTTYLYILKIPYINPYLNITPTNSLYADNIFIT